MGRRIWAVTLGIAVLGLAMSLLADQYWRAQLDNARAQYVEVETAKARNVALSVRAAIADIYQNIRTISFLPSIRAIDRHGETLSAEGRATIQQIYNNLASNFAVSEVYVVPVDFDPLAIDPVTGHHQQPIFALDHLITGTNSTGTRSVPDQHGGSIADDLTGVPDLAGNPQVEIVEYQRLREQMQWFAKSFPTSTSFDGLHVPMLGSGALLTCDNSEFDFTHNDSDRLGLVQVVPFYDLDGRLADGVAAILRVNALQDLLPDGDLALVNPDYGFATFAPVGQAARSASFVAAARPDPDLVYSAVIPIATADPTSHWQLWSGRSPAAFEQVPAVRAIALSRMATLLAVIGLAIGAVIAAFALSRSAEKSRAASVAEAESRAKSSFLAMMSHEIRTPLNGILGMAEQLADTPLDSGQRAQLGIIRQCGDLLLGIINDVLDVSKLESGKVDLELLPVDLETLIESIASMMAPRAAAKGLTFSATSVPLLVEADPTRIKQILVNLVGNAIKFTESGEIGLHAVLDGAHAGQPMLRFSVTDTGIGLSPKAQSQLFRDFHQADPSITRRFGGTGLGLAISRRLVTAMGGTIAVDSQPGRGSTFTVRLPYHPAVAMPESPAASAPAASAGPVNVLVVEDNGINRKVAEGFLKGLGATVHCVVNGAEAVDFLANGTVDLVFMDMQMPVMDGLTATRRIRAAGVTTPIYGLSANAFASDRDECLAAGMDGFVSKPVTRAKLAEVLATCAQRTAPSLAA